MIVVPPLAFELESSHAHAYPGIELGEQSGGFGWSVVTDPATQNRMKPVKHGFDVPALLAASQPADALLEPLDSFARDTHVMRFDAKSEELEPIPGVADTSLGLAQL